MIEEIMIIIAGNAAGKAAEIAFSKLAENIPDFTGSIMINGKEHWFSAWVKESPKAGKFFSVSVGKVKEPIGFKPAGSDELPRNTIEDDSVPF